MKSIKEVILSQKSRIFRVTFTKKDKSVRVIVALRPKPKDSPKKDSPAKNHPNLLLVTDVVLYRKLRKEGLSQEKAKDKSYRMINFDTIIELKAGGKLYKGESNDLH